MLKLTPNPTIVAYYFSIPTSKQNKILLSVNLIIKEFGKNTGENVIHASDSEKSAESEIQHFFPDYVT